MTNERWQLIKGLFETAAKLPWDQRTAWLDHACAADPSLRQEIESLLAANDVTGDFFDEPEKLHFHSRPMIDREVGPYRITDFLGSGGMGEVYRAHDTRLGRDVALKFVKSGLSDPVRLMRFQREARATSALNHPNIVTIYDIGEADGLHYIATELIEGVTLEQLIARGTMDVREALDITLQVVSAVSAAHAAGILHRDIKPQNIMVRSDGLIKVVDFGLAKLIEPDSDDAGSRPSTDTIPGQLLGTVAYMSPEQARGEQLDSRSDLFSIGAVLYEMGTGKQAFPGNTTAAVAGAILSKSPVAAWALNPELPAKLVEIINKALEKDRELRYLNAEELRADLLLVKGDSGSKPRIGNIIRVAAAVAAATALAAGGYFLYRHFRAAAPDLAPQPSKISNMIQTRNALATVQLTTGHVLATGGCTTAGLGPCENPLASAEVFEPRSGKWFDTGAMTAPRLLHTATTLASGRVLVAGGCKSDCTNPHNSSEQFDPQTERWTASGAMPVGRFNHTATLLADGRVLVAGGSGGCIGADCKILASAALYDPRTGLWSATPDMSQHRLGNTATLLLNGQVLVAGGCPFPGAGHGCIGTGTTELFDPANRWSPTSSMTVGRTFASATLLASGNVLVAGGVDSTGLISGAAEIYDPLTRRWTTTGNMAAPRYMQTATLLRNGQVLVAGGGTAVCELYDPATGQWTKARPLGVLRSSHTATLLGNGRVLIAGGHDRTNTPLSSVELFSPATRP